MAKSSSKSDAPEAAPSKSPAAEAKSEKDNLVTVKAVRSFEGMEGFKNPQSQPFDVTRQRAAELFANGLIEYIKASDQPKP